MNRVGVWRSTSTQASIVWRSSCFIIIVIIDCNQRAEINFAFRWVTAMVSGRQMERKDLISSFWKWVLHAFVRAQVKIDTKCRRSVATKRKIIRNVVHSNLKLQSAASRWHWHVGVKYTMWWWRWWSLLCRRYAFFSTCHRHMRSIVATESETCYTPRLSTTKNNNQIENAYIWQ